MMAAMFRGNYVYILVTGSLIFLVYLVTLIPSAEIDDNKNYDIKQRVLLSKETIAVSPVKLKPQFLPNYVGEQTSEEEIEVQEAVLPQMHSQAEADIKQVISGDDMQEDYMKFINHAREKDLQDPFLNKHKFKFLVDNKYACLGEVFLLVLIHSATEKYKERNEIRKTWGSVRNYNEANIVPIFLLARPSDNSSLAAIQKESRTYRDLVQADFIDHYKNLTYKHVMGLHWTMKYCNHTKFVLKTDDDTMVDIYHLMSFLFQKSPDGEIERFLYCSTFKRQGPVRRPSDKWFVTLKDYPFTKYPPYCEGFAYVMSVDVVDKLYTASKSVPFFWIDDVYVTGFLVAKAGIYHHDMEHGHSYNLMQSEHLSKYVQSSIFLLAKYSHLRKNWDRAWNDILTFNRITAEDSK